MKRIVCVLGGTGFVGKRLLLKLSDANFKVNVITRHKNRHMELSNYPNVKLIEANIHTTDQLDNIFANTDIIINLIGINNNNKSQDSYQSAHVNIIRKITASIKKTKVRRIIQISALNADSSLAMSGYLQSKGEAENILKVQTGPQIAVTSLRPSLIFGTDSGFAYTLSRLLKKFRFLPLPCPNTKIAPIYVDDIAAAITESIDNADTFNESYDLCGDTIYSLYDIATIINETQNSNAKIVPLSNFFSKFQAFISSKLPGKVFTKDQYAILQYDAKCNKGIEFMPNYATKPFKIWAQENLKNHNTRSKYFKYRQQAGRI